MVLGRTKGLTFRGKGNVRLVAAQLDDADGNPTEEYVLLRADEFGRLRTVDAGAVATFLGLTDTPASYAGAALQIVRVNAGGDALEFAAATPTKPLINDAGFEHWVLPGWDIGSRSTHTLIADELYYVVIRVERSTTFIRIGIDVDVLAAASVIRLGIYSAIFDGNGHLTPDALTLDAGTVSVATTGDKEIVIAETLDAGFHFLALSSNGTPGVKAGTAGFGSSPVSGSNPVTGPDTPAIVGFSVTVPDGAAALPDPGPAPDLRSGVLQMGAFLRDT